MNVKGKWILMGRLPCCDICECSNCGDMTGNPSDAYCRKCGDKKKEVVYSDDLIDMRMKRGEKDD